MLQKSSSNPDLKTLSSEPLQRTNSSSSSPSSPPPVPLHSDPSFSIFAFNNILQLEPPTQEASQDFSFTATDSESVPDSSVTPKIEPKRLPLFLARGLGIDRVGSGLLDAGEEGMKMMKWKYPVEMGNGEETLKLEMELKKSVDDEPMDALALRDYAHFLYQVKGDGKRAEEYYSRAVLMEPPNGEILAEYARLIWKLHADGERAINYLEKAIKASPKNSEVFASYAGFMWDIEEGSETLD